MQEDMIKAGVIPEKFEKNYSKPLTKFGSKFEEDENKWKNEKEFVEYLKKLDIDANSRDMVKSLFLRSPESYLEIQQVIAVEDLISTALRLPPEAGKLKDVFIRMMLLFNEIYFRIAKKAKEKKDSRDIDYDAVVDLYKIGLCSQYLRKLPRETTNDIKDIISSPAFKAIPEVFKKYGGTDKFTTDIFLNLEKEISAAEKL